MKLFKILLLILLPLTSFSQIQGEDEVYLNGDRIEAKFNGGGLDVFHEFIKKEFDFSKVTKSGTMVAAFTIDEEGNVKGIKIIQMLDIESASEMIRVLKMCPKWEPAKRGGKPISIEIKYPMTFGNKLKSSKKAIAKNNDLNEKNTVLNDTISNAKSVETKPEFVGGVKAFYQFVGKNFRVPDVEGFKGGKIVMSFIVEKDGSLVDIKVLKGIGYGCGEEAIRVLRLSPKWNPGTQNGVPVRCIYSLPITISAK